MNIKDKLKKVAIVEIMKWIVIASLLIVSVIGYYVYHDYNSYIKNITVFVLIMLAASIFLTTKLGKLVVVFGKESNIELQKVVWPTYKDSLYTTFIIIVVTVIISLLLWGLDTILLHMISFGLRL